jgi:hypothetical protein
MRLLLAAAFAVTTVGLCLSEARAMRIAFRSPAQRAIGSELVVIGKVTGFEKDLVQAAPHAGAKDTVGYKVAIVQVKTGVIGAEKLTEVKVGFIPAPKAEPVPPAPVGGPIRPVIRPRPVRQPELAEGQELLLFLAKHPSGKFYVLPAMSPPVDLSTDAGKAEVESVKKIAAILADPAKGLKSDKPEDRAETASVMVMKYRSFPELGGEVEQAAIPVEESRTLLKALTEVSWSNVIRPGMPVMPNPTQAFYALGLTAKDGWVPPAIVPSPPGSPPVDFNEVQRQAFMQWLDGPGKGYQIKKVVAKSVR